MKTAKQSAGILMFRTVPAFQVLLIHPGGPVWANKDEAAWSIPKGEFDGEEPLEAAKREFAEELGSPIEGDLIELTPVRQKSGKLVRAWAVESDFDCDTLRSNTFEMEWPPRSGRKRSYPEVDRAEWFDPEVAIRKINPAQAALILELIERIG